MELRAVVNLIGKVAKPWTDDKGIEHMSFSGNVSQKKWGNHSKKCIDN